LMHPSVEILAMSESPLELIEAAGRTCYKSENKMTPDSARSFTEKIVTLRHESVLEHACATVRFICDRGVSHEIVRHRIASYSQESTRYCDYANGHVSFVIPPWVKVQEGVWDSIKERPEASLAEDLWLAATLCAEQAYLKLRKQGWSPQQARSVLPNSLKTEVVMTANFRSWRNFFRQRTAQSAHPQMREVAIPLLQRMQLFVPVVFDEICIEGLT